MKSTSNYLKPKRNKMKLKDPTKSGLRKKRACLKCGNLFLSKGPYNRICEKCGLMNERIASSTYSVSEKPSSEPSPLEKRFYGLN
ncbi:MAG: hypothetical protein A3D13_09610 [Planctomycetes bacterium RIFCSPHIGHO2_02_FULL_40_12]|nr:MAG: hypothetical protein A3D13_09610 [Planctomycetes bacterium RIFCSPHIGHO2_02_FULL_40_12]OHC03448.1 MAG: hypothetical protein A3H23_08655 [Planctomycetes bacterium RIFCSPLOWO2_12_FULL_40_19]